MLELHQSLVHIGVPVLHSAICSLPSGFPSPLSLLPQILDALNQVVLQLQLTQQQLASSASMTKNIPITSLATTIQSDLSQIQSTLNSILAVMPQSINRCEILWATGLEGWCMMLSWIAC